MPPANFVIFSRKEVSALNAKEQMKIAKFRELAKVGDANNARYNQFVFLLGEPKLPTRHSGVDDSSHPEMEISFIWQDLLERGHTTLKLIHNRVNAQKPCPKVIFMRGPIRSEEDNLTKDMHTGHTLDAYARQIENENQLPIEFHLAGHGTPEFIGPMILERRITPEDFAEYFCSIASKSNLLETLKRKKLVFVFHTCNSAYIEITSENTDQIKEKMQVHSIIGRFFQKMSAMGFENFEVSGFRGFYSTYMNGAGARVTGSLDDDHARTYSAESAKYTILKAQGVVSVELPKGEGSHFPVRFEGNSFRP